MQKQSLNAYFVSMVFLNKYTLTTVDLSVLLLPLGGSQDYLIGSLTLVLCLSFLTLLILNKTDDMNACTGT